MPVSPGSRKRIYSDEPYDGPSGHKHTDPHSEWQLMVTEAMTKANKGEGISFRNLGTAAQIPPGSLFNWLRSPKGAPPRVSYTTDVNLRLAKALKLKPDALADAYNKSIFKPLDPKKPDPAPRAPRPGDSKNSSVLQEPVGTYSVDPLRRYIATLKATGRQSFTMLELEQFASLMLPPE